MLFYVVFCMWFRCLWIARLLQVDRCSLLVSLFGLVFVSSPLPQVRIFSFIFGTSEDPACPIQLLIRVSLHDLSVAPSYVVVDVRMNVRVCISFIFVYEKICRIYLCCSVLTMILVYRIF